MTPGSEAFRKSRFCDSWLLPEQLNAFVNAHPPGTAELTSEVITCPNLHIGCCGAIWQRNKPPWLLTFVHLARQAPAA